MSAEREMTLYEWCAKLPDFHKVNRDLKAKDARITELESALRGAKRNGDDLAGFYGQGWKDAISWIFEHLDRATIESVLEERE